MKRSISFWRTVICLAQVLLLLVSATLATGCGRGKTDAKAKRTRTTETQPAEPDPPPSDALRILAYKGPDDKGYIGAEVVKVAAKDGEVKIVLDTFANDEEFKSKWRDGAGGYDIVLPSYTQLSLLISNDLAAELDKSKIPNLKNIDPKLLGGINEMDKGNKYTVPFVFFPLVVLGVRTDHVTGPVKSLDVLFDEKYRGKVGLADSASEIVATFLMYKGHAPVVGDDSPDKVKDVLAKLRPSVKEFASGSLPDKLKKGDISIALDQFGTLGTLHGSEDKNIRLLVPETGVPIWVESICVAKDAPNPDLALWFINYLLQDDVSLQNTTETGLATVNLAARAKLEASVREDSITYPPPPARAKVLADWLYQEKEDLKKVEPFWKELKAGK